jgi:ABC-type multidrug transport system fused ATPase/permease subunit
MKMNVTKKEFAWYVVSGILVFIGVVLIIFDIIGDNIRVSTADNWILTAQNAVIEWSKINMDWRAWGLIFFLVGALVAVITLSVFAKGADRIVEKEQRRQARLSAIKETDADENKTIEVEVNEVESN